MRVISAAAAAPQQQSPADSPCSPFITEKECFARAVTCRPDWPKAWVNLGNCITRSEWVALSVSSNRAFCRHVLKILERRATDAAASAAASVGDGGNNAVVDATETQGGSRRLSSTVDETQTAIIALSAALLAHPRDDPLDGGSLLCVNRQACYELALEHDDRQYEAWCNLGALLHRNEHQNRLAAMAERNRLHDEPHDAHVDHMHLGASMADRRKSSTIGGGRSPRLSIVDALSGVSGRRASLAVAAAAHTPKRLTARVRQAVLTAEDCAKRAQLLKPRSREAEEVLARCEASNRLFGRATEHSHSGEAASPPGPPSSRRRGTALPTSASEKERKGASFVAASAASAPSAFVPLQFTIQRRRGGVQPQQEGTTFDMTVTAPAPR